MSDPSYEEENQKQLELKEKLKAELFELLDNKYVDLHCGYWREAFDELYYNPFLNNGI